MTQIRYSLAHEHIMSGLIKCPVCGSGMIGSVSRRINKKTGENKDDFYYRCMSRKKYADMTKRLDDLYDKINDMEQNVENINICLEEAAARKVSAKNVYEILGKFDKVYEKMTDHEKKKFYRALIQEIEIHDDREKQSDPILKKVHFRIPLAIEGQLGDCIMLSKNSTVETVVLLVNMGVKPDFTVHLDVDVDDFYRTVGEEKRHFLKDLAHF